MTRATTTFDTLEAAEYLEKSGIENSHAKAIAHTVAKAVPGRDTATGEQVAEIKTELAHRPTRGELYKALGYRALAIVVAVAGLMKLLAL